jgi:hypothetical protein
VCKGKESNTVFQKEMSKKGFVSAVSSSAIRRNTIYKEVVCTAIYIFHGYFFMLVAGLSHTIVIKHLANRRDGNAIHHTYAGPDGGYAQAKRTSTRN